MRIQRALVTPLVFLWGCQRYADFQLPPPEASGPGGPFVWEAAAAPVLSSGPKGDWDSVDVLNPSVVRVNGFYLNLYSGFDGRQWRTGIATSQDGMNWQKLGRALSPEGWEGGYIAANGSALVSGKEILYWYVGGEAGEGKIGLARSNNGGLEWSKLSGPVLAAGPRGSFDESAVADPYVIRRGDRFYMFYLGQDRAGRQRLGVARSRDGVRWEKLRSNPILELGALGSFDERGLGEPAVWSSGGYYWMLYTGRDRAERRRLGLARSLDGAHWEREPGFVAEGAQDWDREAVCDPTVELTGEGAIRVWFGGGDVAAPDHGIHGQIGFAMLKGDQTR
ncbi:MAG TPA: hypothetical protein VKV74_07555 [Bryobacteraceae bacterium]|nr:hypothetical protein [Bryobacteraceae bacterium]